MASSSSSSSSSSTTAPVNATTTQHLQVVATSDSRVGEAVEVSVQEISERMHQLIDQNDTLKSNMNKNLSSKNLADSEAKETNIQPKSESALKSFLSGGVGGICVVLVGHPFDLIKVRMQTTAPNSVVKETIVGIFTQTIRTSGIFGLYKGVSAPLVAVTPLFALSFWSYDMGQRLVCYTKSTTTNQLTLFDKCVAGGLSAIPTASLMIPSERIKVLMQTAAPGQYRGMVDCASQVYCTGGIQSIFRGTGLTLMRDIPGSVAWFGMYEAAKVGMVQMQGLSDASKLSPLSVLSAGGLAGMACWIVQIPFDTLKSRYQSAPDGTYPGGARDVFKRLIREEGAGALFTGIRPALLRAFPANAACFYGMEVSRKLLSFMD